MRFMFLVEANNLSKVYGDGTRALRGVSFGIKKGDLVAIMGPSGSGKSTLMHLLGFLDHYTGGEYKFEGRLVNDYSEKELAKIRNKKIGFIFQSFNLLAKTTVLDNVKLPLFYSDVKENLWDGLAREAIEAVGLGHRLHHLSSELSGGERQRVAIARALVVKPEVVFADEPTGNLDSKSGQKVMEMIQELNMKYGHTVVLVTHDEQMAKYARRIIHLLDGEIKSDSKPSV